MASFTFRVGEDDGGKPVKLDLATLIDTKLLNVANSGGGKSYLLRVIIERTAERVQWIIIDPEGEYATLREKFDFLLIGPDGEIPVDERSAGLLARKLMETRVSAIIDLYGLVELRAPWTAKFLTALLTLPKSLWTPLMVAIDEAHKLAPETPTGSREERERVAVSRKAVITLTDSGRKQNRGAAIATQRLNKLAADARGDLNNNFIGRMVQDLDRERAADILGISRRDSLVLRDLKPGEFFAFGPAFSHNGVARIKVDTAATKHPKAGERHLLDVPKASDALQHILARMGDLPAEAKQEQDALSAAQRRIADLERTLKERPVQASAPRIEVRERIVERPVLNGELPRLETAIRELSETGTRLLGFGEQMVTLGGQVVGAAREVSTALTRFQQAPSRELNGARAFAPVPARVTQATVKAAPPPVRAAAGEREGVLPVGEKKILTAAAQQPDGATRKQLTVLTGYKRSSRDAYLARLAAKGYVQARGDKVLATPEGVAALEADFEPLPTGAELREYWRTRLPPGEKAVLDTALGAYPDPIDRDAVSELTGYKRSSRDAYISRLQARRLVTAERGLIRASDELF